MAAVDATPQSLLFFEGADAVHGLYDTLLNHRYELYYAAPKGGFLLWPRG